MKIMFAKAIPEINFWLLAWMTVIVVILSFIYTYHSYEIQEAKTIENMVNQGYSPIEARCALIIETDLLCAAYIAKTDFKRPRKE